MCVLQGWYYAVCRALIEDHAPSRDKYFFSMASFFEKKGVKFPRTPLLLSVVLTVLLYWFGGIPGWSAPVIAVIQFLLMGGFRFCKLAYHTLPRDVW